MHSRFRPRRSQGEESLAEDEDDAEFRELASAARARKEAKKSRMKEKALSFLPEIEEEVEGQRGGCAEARLPPRGLRCLGASASEFPFCLRTPLRSQRSLATSRRTEVSLGSGRSLKEMPASTTALSLRRKPPNSR